MRKDMKSVRTANSISQNKSFKGHYLLVEGDKDLTVYGKFVDRSKVKN